MVIEWGGQSCMWFPGEELTSSLECFLHTLLRFDMHRFSQSRGTSRGSFSKPGFGTSKRLQAGDSEPAAASSRGSNEPSDANPDAEEIEPSGLESFCVDPAKCLRRS